MPVGRLGLSETNTHTHTHISADTHTTAHMGNAGREQERAIGGMRENIQAGILSLYKVIYGFNLPLPVNSPKPCFSNLGLFFYLSAKSLVQQVAAQMNTHANTHLYKRGQAYVFATRRESKAGWHQHVTTMTD